MAMLSLSKNRVIQWILRVWISLFRGTPLLAQLFFFVYGLFPLIPGLKDMALLPKGILCLALAFSAFMSETIRGAIQSVDKGQMEASRSLGVGHAKTMQKIILPQAVRICLPSLVNQCIITLKDSTIMYAIGLPEIMNQAKVYVGRTFESFATYTWVAVIFLAITSVLMVVSSQLEKRMRK